MRLEYTSRRGARPAFSAPAVNSGFCDFVPKLACGAVDSLNRDALHSDFSITVADLTFCDICLRTAVVPDGRGALGELQGIAAVPPPDCETSPAGANAARGCADFQRSPTPGAAACFHTVSPHLGHCGAVAQPPVDGPTRRGSLRIAHSASVFLMQSRRRGSDAQGHRRASTSSLLIEAFAADAVSAAREPLFVICWKKGEA